MPDFTAMITCPAPDLNVAGRPLIGWDRDGSPITVDEGGNLTRVKDMDLLAENITISRRPTPVGVY